MRGRVRGCGFDGKEDESLDPYRILYSSQVLDPTSHTPYMQDCSRFTKYGWGSKAIFLM